MLTEVKWEKYWLLSVCVDYEELSLKGYSEFVIMEIGWVRWKIGQRKRQCLEIKGIIWAEVQRWESTGSVKLQTVGPFGLKY